MATSRRGRKARFDIYDELRWDDPAYEPIYIPPFVPGLPLDENAYGISRPLWGKARAEWTLCLARDLVAVRPEADTDERREWTAAILWAAALDTGMDHGERWGEVVEDITHATRLDEATAREWFGRLRDLGLDRPKNPPAYWDDYMV